MFTGIIEEVGTIKQINRGSKHITLTIEAEKVLMNTKIGDSISTNGVCLTVTQMSKGEFHVDMIDETLKRTTMKHLHKGSRVNLERALTLQSRLGGHMVSGHIDGVGKISEISKDDFALWIKIQADPMILKYVIEKGSVAIDGISLTVANVDKDSFRVSIIPHTQTETTLTLKKAGDYVNIECDLIGKYVEKLMGMNEPHALTEGYLRNLGY